MVRSRRPKPTGAATSRANERSTRTATDLVDFSATSSKRGLLPTQTDPDPDGSGPLLPPVTEFDDDARGNLTKLTEQGPSGALVTTFREHLWLPTFCCPEFEADSRS